MTHSLIIPAPHAGIVDYFDEIDTLSFLVRSPPRRDPTVPERLFGIDTRLYIRGAFALRLAIFGGYGTGAVRNGRIDH